MKFQYWLVLAIFALGSFIFLARPAPCANTGNCKESMALQVNNDEEGVFAGQSITPPTINLSERVDERKILGESSGVGEKRIYVDLSTQTLTAYEGETIYLQVPISSGKWYETPTGEFTIWSKFRATKMSGGTGADYYYLPNVPFVMFYSGSGVSAGRGFSLHGAYWHNNFGHAMSHGCVNMRTVDAEKLFYWAEEETKITIYGKAP